MEDSLNKNRPVLLLLSGGTWIPAMEKTNYSSLILNPNLKNLTIMALDDRVEIGPNNNFTKIISVPFIDSLIKLGAKTISTLPDIDENIDIFSQRIDSSIKKYLSLNSDVIMIATAGIGGESNVPGHIAGIEPIEDRQEFLKNFQDSNVLYRGYIAKKLQPGLRATATFSLLDKINYFILLILNPEQKAQPLDILLSDTPTAINNFPCVYFRNHPDATIYTDIPKQ
ncbi:MAG: hypothetical protein WC503_01490 [Candidatus Shapirobacteria bacterium]